MIISNWIRDIITLFMFILVVNMIAGNYYLQREFLEPLKEWALATSSLVDDSDEGDKVDQKLPKTSYVESESLLNTSSLISIYHPTISRLDFAEPSRTVPDVYPDIIVPPKISLHKTLTFIA